MIRPLVKVGLKDGFCNGDSMNLNMRWEVDAEISNGLYSENY
jgi:hypothetical protein